jgi:hypothetical protein
MELKDLVGKHILSGVDMNNESIKQWGNYFEDCQVINFVLDGITYTAIEDPDDGYRSTMRKIVTSDKVVSNIFAGQEVLAKMRENDRYQENDILDLVDVVTGKIVLSVGTGNTNDYYPYWVAEFTPENMGVNEAA